MSYPSEPPERRHGRNEVVVTPMFGGIPLCGADASPCAGAVFGLRESARESEVLEVDGWQVQVIAAESFVITHGGLQETYEDALSASLLYAQKGLDLMSLHGGNNLLVRGFDDDHVVWWNDTRGLTIRVVSLSPVRVDVPPVSLRVTDASGNLVVAPKTPTLAWHESFRYFRLSQTTDDLFDAYRNAYLALESLLSTIAPQMKDSRGRLEREGDWFRRALTEADKIVPLASLAPPGTPDPAQYLSDDLFRDMRSAMSHAKTGRKVLLPQNEAERQAVTDSLKRLVGFFLRLSDAHLGTQGRGGGTTDFAFRKAKGSYLDRTKLVVSDDESPSETSSPTRTPAAGRVLELNAKGPTQSPRPFVVTRTWAIPVADLSELPFIRRTVVLLDDEPIIGTVLEDRLVLGSAQTLEVMVGLWGSNSRQPRERYST